MPNKMYVATDIIIEYDNGKKDGIIMITRKFPPYGIALPGGFLESYLTAAENAIKEAKEETGLEIKISKEIQSWVNSSPDRDPRGRVVSVTYVATGIGKLKAGDDAKTASLYSIDEIISMLGKSKFAFDHENILKRYLKERGLLK